MFNRKYIFKGSIFYCYVSLLSGIRWVAPLSSYTVDGRNPAQADMVNSRLFTGLYTSQVLVVQWKLRFYLEILEHKAVKVQAVTITGKGDMPKYIPAEGFLQYAHVLHFVWARGKYPSSKMVGRLGVLLFVLSKPGKNGIGSICIYLYILEHRHMYTHHIEMYQI